MPYVLFEYLPLASTHAAQMLPVSSSNSFIKKMRGSIIVKFGKRAIIVAK